MSKSRQYSIVLHNVKSDSKGHIEAYVASLTPVQSLIAIEPYPEQDGYHVHIFLRFSSPRSFTSVLNKFKHFISDVVEPKPEGEERDWGRVQVDVMRGSFKQATDYLTNPKKSKICDPDVKLVTRPNPYEEQRRCQQNEHIKRYYGIYYFPDVGQELQGFQYVELLISQSKQIPELWLQTYTCVKDLEI